MAKIARRGQQFLFIKPVRFFQKRFALFSMSTRKFLDESYRGQVSDRSDELDATGAIDCRGFAVKFLGCGKVTAEKFNQSSHFQYLRVVPVFGLSLFAFLARAFVIAAKQRKPSQNLEVTRQF